MTSIDPTPDASEDEGAPDPEPQNDLSRRERARMENQIAESAAENRKLRLENLVLGAGVDPTSAKGKLFTKGYEGDLSSDAVKNELIAAEILVLPGDPSEGPTITEAEAAQTDERRMAAAGAVPEAGPPTENPGTAAIKAGVAVMDSGGNEETAMAVGLDVLANAAINGDQRVRYEPGRPDPRHPDLGW